MSTEELQLIRLLARFKLQLRRLHDRAVDLSALKSDGEYAARILAEVEELTDDEELLVLALQLRERLLERPALPPVPAALPVPQMPASQMHASRHYRYGARGG